MLTGKINAVERLKDRASALHTALKQKIDAIDNRIAQDAFDNLGSDISGFNALITEMQESKQNSSRLSE